MTYLAEKAAEIAKFTVEQADNYEDNLKVYRDLKNSLDTALEEGIEKGFKKGVEEGKEIGIKESKIEIAKNMLLKGFSYDDIFAITNLTKEDLE